MGWKFSSIGSKKVGPEAFLGIVLKFSSLIADQSFILSSFRCGLMVGCGRNKVKYANHPILVNAVTEFLPMNSMSTLEGSASEAATSLLKAGHLLKDDLT
jgi:hypothetical protein